MRIKTLLASMTIAATVGTAFMGISPASADAPVGSATFNASPEPVHRGSYTHLSGSGYNDYVKYRLGGYGESYVNLWFKKAGTTSYVYKGYDYMTPGGYYSKYIRQYSSGTWMMKVVWYDDEGFKYRGPVKWDYVKAI